MSVPPLDTPRFLTDARCGAILRRGAPALAVLRLTDGVYLDANDQFLRLLGHTAASLLGRTDAALGLWADHAARASLFEQLADQERVPDAPAALCRADGSLLNVMLTLESWTFDGTPCAVITLREDRCRSAAVQEIHERKLVEAELTALNQSLDRRVQERTAALSAANEELARSARLKDEFLASMSHELRTPLNAVLGRSEALLELVHGPLNERQARAVRSIEESGRHLLDLINDILDLSKIEAGKLELRLGPVVVADLCQTSMRMVQQTALTRRIALATVIDPQVGTIVADERRLRQVLVNLLANAVKFTPPNGGVELRVRLEAEQTATALAFTVSDTGVGIAAEDLPRLFQPFVQLDSGLHRQYGGTGLGLALVKRLVGLHGGTVGVASAVGRGSQFTVRIPLSAAAAPLHQPTRPSSYWSTPAIAHALVISSAPSCAEQLTRLLGEVGVTVHVVDHPAAAEQHMRTAAPGLIVLDVEVASGVGWDYLTQLKRDPQTSGLPVLLIAPREDLGRALHAGAAGFLSRPIDRRRFQRMIGTTLLGSAAAAQALGVLTPLNPAPNQRILLVEDDRENTALLLDYFSALGYQMLSAEDGVEAICLAQHKHPALVVMDIQLPRLDGLSAIRAIRADPSTAALPIIALTALTMPGDREACLAAGANDYLSKPVTLRRLREAVESLIGPSMVPLQPAPTREDLS